MKRLILIPILICMVSTCFGAEYSEQRDSGNVLTGYIRTLDGAGIPIANDNSDYQEVLVWIANGGVADADTTVLARAKQVKINEYKKEGVRRIGLEVPTWDSFGTISVIASIWNMLGTPNTPQSTAKDIYVYVKDTAIPAVNVLTTINDVQAVDVVNDVNWP